MNQSIKIPGSNNFVDQVIQYIEPWIIISVCSIVCVTVIIIAVIYFMLKYKTQLAIKKIDLDIAKNNTVSEELIENSKLRQMEMNEKIIIAQMEPLAKVLDHLTNLLRSKFDDPSGYGQ